MIKHTIDVVLAHHDEKLTWISNERSLHEPGVRTIMYVKGEDPALPIALGNKRICRIGPLLRP